MKVTYRCCIGEGCVDRGHVTVPSRIGDSANEHTTYQGNTHIMADDIVLVGMSKQEFKTCAACSDFKDVS